MNTARNAIHLVTLGIACFARDYEQTRAGVVEGTNTFEDRFDGPIDAEARVGENSNFFQQLEPVLKLSVVTAPARDDVTKYQHTDWRQQKVVEIDGSVANAQQTDNRIDRSRSKGQTQAVVESPTKRSNDDREEEEVIKKTVCVTGEGDERHIPKEVQPRDNLVGHERIAAHRLVINQ